MARRLLQSTERQSGRLLAQPGQVQFKTDPQEDVKKTLFGTFDKGPLDVVGGLVKGAAKGVAETAQGISQLGLRGAEIATRQEKGAFGSQRTIGESIGKDETLLEAKTPEEKAGKFFERIAEFAIPATKVAKATKGAGFVKQLFARAGTAGAVGAAQEGEVGKNAAIAAGVETLLPIGSRFLVGPITGVIKRLTKGLGAGLSGVQTDVIDTLIRNPNKAKEAIKQLNKVGNFEILEKNAKTIVNGVSKIKTDARSAFGKGLEKLSKIDIKPKTFRDSIQTFLDDIGSSLEGNTRILSKVEFNDPKNLQKASDLIDELSRTDLDGKSLRSFMDKISNSKFKTATTDERLSFNAFIKDFEGAVKDSINKSTGKLDEINAAFTKDLQLAEETERIFANVEFKNLSEVGRVAQKLEQLFSQKGLNPRDIDDFLTKIGISPDEFRTSEGIRQISQITQRGNTEGLTVAEVTRAVTSSVLTPKAVRDISILVGLSDDVVKPLLESVSPTARAGLIESLINLQQETR